MLQKCIWNELKHATTHRFAKPIRYDWESRALFFHAAWNKSELKLQTRTEPLTLRQWSRALNWSSTTDRVCEMSSFGFATATCQFFLSTQVAVAVGLQEGPVWVSLQTRMLHHLCYTVQQQRWIGWRDRMDKANGMEGVTRQCPCSLLNRCVEFICENLEQVSRSARRKVKHMLSTTQEM